MTKLQFRINQKIEFVNEEGQLGISLVQDWTKDYFMVTVPLKGTEQQLLHVGDEVTGIYYHDDGKVYMFNSMVLDRMVENIPLYKLSIPDELTRVQRRSYVRLDITMPVKYAEVAKELESLLEENGWEGILQDSSIPWETGTIMDISGGGINLAANRPLEEGDRVYVYIRSEELEIGIKGEVVRRYTKILDNVAVYHHGVKFVEINEAERDRIIGFIFKKYREIRHKGVES
jgi:c-di-GMP-binding flagellar brake protein YcgR